MSLFTLDPDTGGQRLHELIDFFENAPVPLHWVAEDGRILWANRAELDLLGYTREEYIGRLISEFHADPDAIVDILQRLSRNETLHNYEARLRRKDGSIRYVLITCNVYRENGKFVHTRCFTRDITERKAAEETRRPDEHVRQLVQWIRDYAIFMLDCDGHVVTWNTGARVLKGYVDAEILGRHFSCFYTPEDRQAGKPERFLTLARERGRVEDKGWRVRKDGTRFWADVVLTALPDDSGQVRGFAKITRDLTERQQAEEALRKAEQARLLDSSHDAIFVRDAEDRITYWNEGAVETYGYAPEEALGKVPHELLRTEFPGPLESIREKLHRDNRWSGELIQRRRDGERVVVISRWVLDRDAQGWPKSILESNNDITERKRAETALRQWEYVFNHAGWAVAIGDPFDNTLLFANPAYATMHGYTVEELIGKPVANLFAPESRSDLPKHADAVDQHGDYVYESLHLHKDGTRFPVRTHVTAFRDETGRVLYRASTSQDLTDHKRAERERERLVAALQQERRQLQETQRALQEKLRDLETFHDAAVGREMKIIELQREVRRLQQQLDGLKPVGSDRSREKARQ